MATEELDQALMEAAGAVPDAPMTDLYKMDRGNISAVFAELNGRHPNLSVKRRTLKYILDRYDVDKDAAKLIRDSLELPDDRR